MPWPKNSLTAENVREVLAYNPASGEFRWRVSVNRAAKAGMIAGHKRKDGYLAIAIGGPKYFAHRLAWLYVHGEWPAKFIDHANGDRSDNRLVNLRLASRSQNNHNAKRRYDNVSGYTGVCFHRREKRWVARIRFDGKNHHLGYFETAETAGASYREAALKHFGEFAGRT